MIEQSLQSQMQAQTSTSPSSTLLLKTPSYSLSSFLSPSPKTLTLTLSIPQPSQKQTTQYTAIIQADSEIGLVLDSLQDLMDYLQDPRNVKVNLLDGSLVLVSRTEVKGKEKEIQVCRIGMGDKRVVRMREDEGELRSKIMEIQQACNRADDLTNAQLKQFLSNICSFLLHPQPHPSAQPPAHSQLDPIINKIVLLGKEQQMIKDKIAACNEKLLQMESQASQAIAGLGKQIKDRDEFVAKLVRAIEECRLGVDRIGEGVEEKVEEKLTAMNNYIKKKIDQLSQQLQTLHKYLRENRQAPPEKPRLPQPSFTFSPTQKHKSIKLLSPLCVQGVDNIRSKIVLLAPTINPARSAYSEKQEYTVKIRIVNDASDILVGVADVEKVRGLGFAIQSWGSGNHGGYYINSGGYLYSYHRKDDNDILKSFTFKDGDIIQITLSQLKKCIIFRNRSQNCMLEYDDSVKPERLHFCVVLHKNNSKAEIVQ